MCIVLYWWGSHVALRCAVVVVVVAVVALHVIENLPGARFCRPGDGATRAGGRDHPTSTPSFHPGLPVSGSTSSDLITFIVEGEEGRGEGHGMFPRSIYRASLTLTLALHWPLYDMSIYYQKAILPGGENKDPLCHKDTSENHIRPIRKLSSNLLTGDHINRSIYCEA